MKALLGGIALSILAAAPVMAADMPVKAAPAPAAVAVFNWTGFYIGATAGYGRGRPHHHDTGGADQNSTDFTMAGFVAGGTVGYNLQFNQIVLGVEGDFSWSDIHGTGSTTPGFFNCAGACRTEIESFATARGRVGWAFGRFLPYVTGGGAWSRLEASVGQPVLTTGRKTNGSWVVGGGIEVAFTDNWSFKAEYLHFDVKDFQYDLNGTCGATPCFTRNNDFDVFRFGINYRFGGPVVARF